MTQNPTATEVFLAIAVLVMFGSWAGEIMAKDRNGGNSNWDAFFSLIVVGAFFLSIITLVTAINHLLNENLWGYTFSFFMFLIWAWTVWAGFLQFTEPGKGEFLKSFFIFMGFFIFGTVVFGIGTLGISAGESAWPILAAYLTPYIVGLAIVLWHRKNY